MKKLILLATTLASVAFAADYIFFAEAQSGNGTNGMTRAAPTAATEGAAVKLSTFSITDRPLAQVAKVSIRATGTNVFQNAGNIANLRCYHYGPDSRDSTGATYAWKRCSYADMLIDGGSSGTVFANSMEFPTVTLQQPITKTDRFLWACDNCQQSSSLDAGVTVSIEMLTGPN